LLQKKKKKKKEKALNDGMKQSMYKNVNIYIYIKPFFLIVIIHYLIYTFVKKDIKSSLECHDHLILLLIFPLM